jgi:hypothetical protein
MEVEGESLDGLVARMAEYVAANDHISFVELERNFPIGGGECAFCIGKRGNQVLWCGLTDRGVDAVVQLLTHHAVFFPSEVMVYAIDGGMLGYPVGVKPPKGDYKDPHWIPVVIRPRRRGVRGAALGADGRVSLWPDAFKGE